MSSRLIRSMQGLAVVISLGALALSIYVLTSPNPAARGLDEVRAALVQSRQQTAEALATLGSATADRVDGLANRLDQLVTQRLEDQSAFDRRLSQLEGAVRALRSAQPGADAVAELLESASGDAVESGTFVVLQSGVEVGIESFALYRAPGGYLLRSSGAGSRLDAAVDLLAAVRTDDGYRAEEYALRGSTQRGDLRITARAEEGQVDVSIQGPEGTTEDVLSIGANLAFLDDVTFAPFVLLYRGIQSESLEPWTAVVPWLAAAVGFEIGAEESITLSAADVRVAATRREVAFDDGRAAAFYVVDGRVVGIEWSDVGLVAYRSDVFPDGFLVQRRTIRDLAIPMGVIENERSVENSGVTLNGTLTYPMSGGETIPIVLLLPDLGPFDRNGDRPGLQSGLLKQLARGLAQIGVASYRFDLRGTGKSGGSYDDATLHDLLTDARVALYLLRALPFADRAKIYVFGHGIGGTIASLLVSQGAAAGVITLGAPAHSYDTMVLDELRRRAEAGGLPDERVEMLVGQERDFFRFVVGTTGTWSNVSDEEVHAALPQISEEECVRRRKSVPLALVRDLLGIDPLDVMKTIVGRALILQGDKDFQVPVAEGGLLARSLIESGNEKTTVAILLDVNHAGRRHVEAASSRESHLDRDLDGQLLSILADWLSADLGLPGGGQGSPASQT